eukprot:83557_1
MARKQVRIARSQKKRPISEVDNDDGNYNKPKRMRRNHTNSNDAYDMDIDSDNKKQETPISDTGLCKNGCGRTIDPIMSSNETPSNACCKSCVGYKSGGIGPPTHHDLQCRIRNTPRNKKGKLDPDAIYKIGTNEDILYGDGGGCKMIWDIYACDKLKTVNHEIVAKLKKNLIALGLKLKDWREGEPIMNLIDPDLYIYKYYEKNEQYWLSDTHKNDITQGAKDFMREFDSPFSFINPERDKEYIENNHPKHLWKRLQIGYEKGYFIRRKYQWLATQFLEKNEGKIEIKSNIHNISSRSKYNELYKGIEHIFEGMLPLFNKFPIFKGRKDKEFQVIVKSQ